MKQYGITEVARLLGISKEAIRKYEAKGLLRSVRDEDNGYRKYDTWDVAILIQIRMLRGMGFSQADIGQVINYGDLPELEAEFSAKKDSAAKALLESQKRFLLLEEQENVLRDLRKNKGDFWIEYRPGLYVLEMGEQFTLTEDEELQRLSGAWLKNSPFVFQGALIDENQVTREVVLEIEEKHAQELDLETLTGRARYIPSQLCACMVLESIHGVTTIGEELRRRVGIIRAGGYTTTGEAITRNILFHKRDGEYHLYHRVWVPIQK